jgi:hypothetical protein
VNNDYGEKAGTELFFVNGFAGALFSHISDIRLAIRQRRRDVHESTAMRTLVLIQPITQTVGALVFLSKKSCKSGTALDLSKEKVSF